MGRVKDYPGIICHICKNLEHSVKETRRFRHTIRRRRLCSCCDYSFYTTEYVDDVLYGKRQREGPINKRIKKRESVFGTQCIHWDETNFSAEDPSSTPCTLGFPEARESCMCAVDCSAFWPHSPPDAWQFMNRPRSGHQMRYQCATVWEQRRKPFTA